MPRRLVNLYDLEGPTEIPNLEPYRPLETDGSTEVRKAAQQVVDQTKDKRIDFGVCKGQTFDHVWSDKPQYCKWILEHSENTKNAMLQMLLGYVKAQTLVHIDKQVTVDELRTEATS